MEPQVVRYSDRPELWGSIAGPSSEVWLECNQHGETLNHYWAQLYDVFPEWQFVLYGPAGQTVLAEGQTIPLAWDGTGTVAERESWTGMLFPETGDYVFPAGLSTVRIDRAADTGEYWRPNIWIMRQTGGGGASG